MRVMSMEVYVVWCARRSPPREIVKLKNGSGSARPGGVFDFEVRSCRHSTQKALRLHWVYVVHCSVEHTRKWSVFDGSCDWDPAT